MYKKNVLSKTSLTSDMSKSGKSAYFRHIIVNNFFYLLCIFKNFFYGFEISVKFCVFDTFIYFFPKIFFRSYYYFFKTLKPYEQETAQKTEKKF